MDPELLEFKGENVMIGVIPNFNADAIHLISCSVGPFRAGLPLHIPLWLAVHLKKQQKCRFVPPNWMDRDLLEDLKAEEKRVANFTKVPSEHFMIISKLVFCHAPEDVPYIEEIKTLIKDIFDFRQAKLRTAIDAQFGGKDQLDGSKQLSLKNLTQFELSTCRTFLAHASDLMARLERVCQQQASSINNDSTYSQM